MDAPVHGQNRPHEEKAVIAWIKRNAIPLAHIEAGNGFADLQPLKTMLSGAKVVGLGEATHGTREFFQLKHRLLEFLVSEMGFNAFAMEASFTGCQPINEYVLHGTGDRATVLTGQRTTAWDTEELSLLVDWMRAYNQSVPDQKKVRFYGLEMWPTGVGRAAVLEYLRRVNPGRLASVRALFEVLAPEEAKWPRRIDEASKETLRGVLPQLQGLIDHLSANRDVFARRSSLAEFDRALRCVLVMKQFAVSYTVEPESRVAAQVENLMYLINQAQAETRFVIWAHNAHIRVGNEGHLGQRLREKYGQGYVACGFEFDQGSFQSRAELSPTVLGDFKTITLPAAPTGSLAWYLSQAHTGNFMLDLRAPAGNPVIERWLQAPQGVHFAGWVCREGSVRTDEMSIAKEYDGIAFVERTTPARPTANALRMAAAGEGL